MPDALIPGVSVKAPNRWELNMSGNDIKFATHTPEPGSSSEAPLRLRTWFDHTRNMMVVEVVAEPAAKAASSGE